MKTKRFNETKIMHILKQAEEGISVLDLCREHGMSSASFYKWRAKYSGMGASKIAELKAAGTKIRRLESMYIDASMQIELLKEALGKKD